MGLTSSLVSYWKLDEASGDAIDSHGSNNLTDNATVGAAAGKINGARDFEEANSEYFRIASNSSLQTGDIDFTLTCWVKFESIGNFRRLISKFGNDATLNEYVLGLDNPGDKFAFALQESGGAIKSVTANTFGAVSMATWYFLAAWYDKTNDRLNISVNDGAVDQTSSVGPPAATTAAFNLGCLFTGFDLFAIQFHDGLLDEVAFWKRLLTAGEITQLYNAGAGLTYPLGDNPIGRVLTNYQAAAQFASRF